MDAYLYKQVNRQVCTDGFPDSEGTNIVLLAVRYIIYMTLLKIIIILFFFSNFFLSLSTNTYLNIYNRTFIILYRFQWHATIIVYPDVSLWRTVLTYVCPMHGNLISKFSRSSTSVVYALRHVADRKGSCQNFSNRILYLWIEKYLCEFCVIFIENMWILTDNLICETYKDF